MRENYERALRRQARRIAQIDAREGGFATDQEARAEKITRDRVAGTLASLKGGAKGRAGSRSLKAAPPATTWRDIYKAQDEYLARVTREWGEGAARKQLQEATAMLQQNTTRINSHLTAVTEAAQAMSTRVLQSGVLDKAIQSGVAAREAGERLSARWERERAARERERTQREREAGERTRARP